ncbi:MAG: SgcJ/EcaC family oxidoreductase [Saprospiraceae bacterium]|nr:SgcJ/EcaC family oxidoreductase [Saprospiraceae bacterium]MCB0545044.1 SgcJ/EcaC family oxidoreductase [Saprospiraceae bacterium]MCB0577359.1 SgcJ/EcaC family oxidoreductase [Saprospiraceae bacterium]MCB9307494.1 SgcJ/EcaC family oxidoreductase [Lewinellaceae bacterium]MCB9355338.1 SgcJ/EcaC family oxidoreductase [Lewinellaceae bacterium]
MKNFLFSILTLSFFALSAHQMQAQTTAADEQALRDVYADIWKQYINADAAKLCDHYTEDATSVAWNGKVVQGKANLLALTEEMMKTDKPDPATHKYEVQSVRTISKDVAIAIVGLQGTSQMGDQVIHWKGINSVTFVRQGKDWKVALEVSTPIMEGMGN